MGKVILNLGETEFDIGLLLVGATRTKTCKRALHLKALSQTLSALPRLAKRKAWQLD
jgi:hypothetical protein